MGIVRQFIAALLVGFGCANSALAASEGIPWDTFPLARLTDKASLQHGAKLFVNYCLNCHSAAYMRYTRLREIGLTEEHIKRSLMFTADKIGETMKSAIDPLQGKAWFGGVPPDLTLIARSRSVAGQGSGADYLYTYLRSYYRDDTKATGWNNLAFPSVGMPHAMWELQGQRRAIFTEVADPHEPGHKLQLFRGYEQITPGLLSPLEYENSVADLVAFLTWMSEPVRQDRVRIGVAVLLFLGVFTFIAWRLNAAYWHDVR